jgi:hypothetical protein
MADVCQELSIKWAPKRMPHYLGGNRSNVVNPHLLFNDTTRQYIEELCHREIEYFGYEYPFTD